MNFGNPLKRYLTTLSRKWIRPIKIPRKGRESKKTRSPPKDNKYVFKTPTKRDLKYGKVVYSKKLKDYRYITPEEMQRIAKGSTTVICPRVCVVCHNAGYERCKCWEQRRAQEEAHYKATLKA